MPTPHACQYIDECKIAQGVILWFLNNQKMDAVTLPPFGIYIRPEFMGDLKLRRHESVHWDQYKRMGAIKFYIVYLWGMVRYGYWAHPMEIEAREKS